MTEELGYCCLKKGNAPDPLVRRRGSISNNMIKILHFGRSCKAYLRLYAYRSPDIEQCCESCRRRMHKHGFYSRSVTTKQETFLIPIYRQYCPGCGQTVSLLPDFLAPWSRVVTWVREFAMNRRLEGTTWNQTATSTSKLHVRMSRCTLKRWWRRFLSRAESAASWIAGQLVHAGFHRDLLALFANRICPRPIDTLHWFQNLLPHYCPVRRWRRGYWSYLNSRLPETSRL